MYSQYLELLTHPALQAVWVMILVVLVEQIWAWPDKYHPLSFVRLLAIRMGEKVHSSKSKNTVMQQRISGTLGFLVLVLPLMVILAIMINLAEFPVFFNSLLLLVSIQFQSIFKQSEKISLALANNKKVLARHLLDNIVLRETDKLTPVGIGKATIETLLLRFNQQFFTVIFWYFVLGGIGALSYRLLYEFSHCWNIKLSRFQHFGLPLAKILALLQWIPVRLSSLILVLAQNITKAVQAYINLRKVKAKSKSTHLFQLNLQGGAIGVELSGPAYYNGTKIRLPKCGGQRQVRHEDIKRTMVAIQKTKALMVVLSLLINAIIFAGY